MLGCCNPFLNANDLIQADASYARNRYLQRYRLDDVILQKGSNSKLEKLEKTVFSDSQILFQGSSQQSAWRFEHLCLCVYPRLGRLVGEWPPASALPSLVSLRLFPEAFGWCAAPQSGHFGGEALCHRGTRWPGHKLVYSGLCAMPHAHEHEVTRHNPRIRRDGVATFALLHFQVSKLHDKKMPPDLKMSKCKYYLLR